MKVISTDKAPAAIGPYSQARVINGLIFASGQIPIAPETGELAVGLEGQAEQVFRNVAAILEAAGSDMAHVVKTTLFIKHMDDFAAINAIYTRHFSEPYPASRWRVCRRTCCWNARSSRRRNDTEEVR